MAKIKVIGDVAVVTSTKKLEDIKTLEKYNHKALSLYETDEHGRSEEVFRVATTEGPCSINQNGVSFNSAARDGSGLAVLTIDLPAYLTCPDEVKSFLVDSVGTALTRLGQVEDGMNLALGVVKAQMEKILADIEMA